MRCPMPSKCFRHARFNPKGIASFSPRLARLREGLPWVIADIGHNPERRCIPAPSEHRYNLFQGCGFFGCKPWVARFLATQGLWLQFRWNWKSDNDALNVISF